MTDRTTKALLLAVTAGLWANVASEWLRPVSVQAIGAEPQEIAQRLVQFDRLSDRELARDRTFRRAVERVVEDCNVYGGSLDGAYVSNDYVYGGTVSGSYISC
jgi:hypothetical protein